jgi:hypothetical protein
MSQATLSERAYVNSNLFSGHYLDERVVERDEWDCDEAAQEALDDLRSLYELEGSLVEGYGEDALIDNWIDEVLDVLGFGTQKEVTLPNGGGYVDELLFEDSTARRDAAKVFLDTDDTTETEAYLVESFVPVAVEKADGFANFRETATKTNSLVDRLEAIELPDFDEVAEDLARYREAVERAEELDEKIERTDDLIDEIVYDLYGLTDEEIEVVEEAVEE